MINAITVKNFLGESVEMDLFHPEKTGFNIKNIEGLGPVKATVNTSEIATGDGTQYTSARLGQRNIVFTLDFFQTQGVTIEELRLKSYRYFPVKTKVELTFKTDAREARAVGWVESNESNIFSERQGSVVSVICPSSYFESLTDGQLNETLFGDLKPTFEFPFSNESLTEKLIEMSYIERMSENNIWYEGEGNAGVYLTMYFRGPVTNIKIFNLTTETFFAIDTAKLAATVGSPIQAGDSLEVCTVSGQKYIRFLRAGKYTNVLNALDRGSTWFQLQPGDNKIAYSADTGSNSIQLKIENAVYYKGL